MAKNPLPTLGDVIAPVRHKQHLVLREIHLPRGLQRARLLTRSQILGGRSDGRRGRGRGMGGASWGTAAEADRMLSLLMGGNVAPRKEFIKENAETLDWELLDI